MSVPVPASSQFLAKSSDDDERKRKSSRNRRGLSMRRDDDVVGAWRDDAKYKYSHSTAFASTRMLRFDNQENSESSLNLSGLVLSSEEVVPVVCSPTVTCCPRYGNASVSSVSASASASSSSLETGTTAQKSHRRSRISELRHEMSQTRLSKVTTKLDEPSPFPAVAVVNPHLLRSPTVRKSKKRAVSQSPSTLQKQTLALPETTWKRNGSREKPSSQTSKSLQNHFSESDTKKHGIRKGGSMRNILRNKRRLEQELHRSDIFHFVLHKAVPSNQEDQTCSNSNSSTLSLDEKEGSVPLCRHPRRRRSQQQGRRMSLDRFLRMKQQSECLVVHNDTHTEESDTWQMAADLSRSASHPPFFSVVDQDNEDDDDDDEDASVVSLELLEAIHDQKQSTLIPQESGTTAMSEELESQSLTLDLDDLQLLDDCPNHAGNRNVVHVKEYAVVDPAGNKGIYSGMISNTSGMPCGQGRLEYLETGHIYEGKFVHGYWTGTGRCIFIRLGEDYTGSFLDNIRHGHGVTKYQDGRIFEGTYMNGVKTEGKMTYQDGSTYLGHWSNGARHGRGTYTFANGSVYIGEFENDRMHGSGVLTWSNGKRYVGTWNDGRRHGPGKEFRPNGTISREGIWEEGNFLS